MSDPQRPGELLKRTPWWGQALVGAIGVAMSATYGARAVSGETSLRDLIIGALWLGVGLFWFFSAWVAYQRQAAERHDPNSNSTTSAEGDQPGRDDADERSPRGGR